MSIRPIWAVFLIAALAIPCNAAHTKRVRVAKTHNSSAAARLAAKRKASAAAKLAAERKAAAKLAALTKPVVTPAVVSPIAGNYNWAASAAPLPTTHVYDGQNASAASLSAASWGGGSGVISNDVSYVAKGNAIKIFTRSLYEGAKINFDPPVDVGGGAQSTKYFQLLICFADTTNSPPSDDTPTPTAALPDDAGASTTDQQDDAGAQTNDQQDDAGAQTNDQQDDAGAQTNDQSTMQNDAYVVPSGSHGQTMADGVYYAGGGTLFHLAQRGMPPGVLPPGVTVPQGNRGYRGPPSGVIPGFSGPPPGVYPGGYPRKAAPAAPSSPTPGVESSDEWTPPLSTIRIVFTLVNGAQAEVLRPIPPAGDFEDPIGAWRSIGVPLSVLKFPAGKADSPLASITLGGDGVGTFYIGQINLVDDDTPLVCTAGTDQDVAAGDEVNLEAQVQSGASMVKYSWDFDSANGILPEAEGQTVTHTYDTGNKDYIATLTVSDIDGIKQPCVAKTTIKVEE